MDLHTLMVGLLPKPSLALPNPQIHSIRYDSRLVGPGDLYVAILGTRSDGHEHIPAAILAGASAIICDQIWFASQNAPDPKVVWLPVSNPRQALAEVSAAFYGYPGQELTLIGITGTNGKTTTAHLISQLLSSQGMLCGWIGTLGAGYGNTLLPGQYTTPFPPELHQLLRQMRQQGVMAVVMECSSHALEQHRLDALAFDAAVFTNLTQDHLDYHGTMQAYCAAKTLLFSRLLKPEGKAWVNAADPAAKEFVKASQAPVHSFAVESAADLCADNLSYDPEGVSFQLHWQAQSRPVRLRLPGQFNVANALAALGVALSLKCDLAAGLTSLAEIQGVPGRLERVSPDGHPFAVYVDYAHTPDSLENALRTVRQFSSGRVLTVFGCGGDRDRGKRPLMGAAAEAGSDQIFITSDNPRSEAPETILAQILTGLKTPDKAQVIESRQAAIAAALSAAQAGDVVLIAGKGHETYQIIGNQTLHFDDREQARQLLSKEN